jgi:uncharacterized coiled-coil protein SlyX
MTEEEKFEERKKYNAPFLRVFDYLAKEKMMNQGQFAKVIDSESGYISLLRNGKKKVGPDYVARIAAEFAKHFDDQQHLNPDFIEGKSPYMIIENVPDDEVLEKINRDGNPDYDLVKQRKQQEPLPTSSLETSFMLEKVLSLAIDEIKASTNKTIAALEDQIAEQKRTIDDLRKQVADLQKDKTSLQVTVEVLQKREGLGTFIFPPGVADKGDQESTRV